MANHSGALCQACYGHTAVYSVIDSVCISAVIIKVTPLSVAYSTMDDYIMPYCLANRGLTSLVKEATGI